MVVTVIDAAPRVVFDLELDMDVHAASLPTSREMATTSTGRPQVALGDEVTFRARHFGVVWRMTSRITAHDRPHRFVDEQVRGPFRALHHEHLFEALGAARTRMTEAAFAPAIMNSRTSSAEAMPPMPMIGIFTA